ncbi:hypothetical protein HK100_006660 [Physocladia obscura]|uniref:RNB domain-containing protein n=1 Tax=Physocladia obscura TaxID=109957 RepID=A0AAD5TB57_9FUNG|nr:hypothetical protein HK100_006660 [Physocladia obscura]
MAAITTRVTSSASKRVAGIAAKVQIQVGDLAQVRREPCIVVRVPSPLDQFYVSLTVSGHALRHAARDVGFVATGWSKQMSAKAISAGEVAMTTATPTTTAKSSNSKTTVIAAESSELLATAQIPPTILTHLARFDAYADRLLYEHGERFSQAYIEFFAADSDNPAIVVSVEDVARWVFKSTENNCPSPAELYATHTFLSKNIKMFAPLSETNSSYSPIDSNPRFLLRGKSEVDEISWIEQQMRGVRIGDELKSFLNKAVTLIERANASPVVETSMFGVKETVTDLAIDNLDDIAFTETDLRFINIIKGAAFKPYPNPYIEYVNRGILSRLPFGYSKKPSRKSTNNGPTAFSRGLDAIRLLKDLGVLTPWENTAILAAKSNGGFLDGIPGHDLSDWADSAQTDANIWGDRLLVQETMVESALQETPLEELPTSKLQIPITLSKSISETINQTADPLLRAVKKNVIFPSENMSDDFIDEKLANSSASTLSRRDFENIPVYVIDSPTAQELDDGISIEHTISGETWLHVHIADPTARIPSTHPLAALAQLRGTSMYLPERHYPMIPDSLSNTIFNLGKTQYALTFSTRVGGDGDLIDYKISPSIVRNVKILHYRDVNRVLDWSTVFGAKKSTSEFEAGFSDMPWVEKLMREIRDSDAKKAPSASITQPEISKDLIELQKLAYKHMQWRVSHGGFASDQPNFNVKVTPYPLAITPNFPTRPFEYEQQQRQPLVLFDSNAASHLEPASNMVSECMIMANRVAAKFCAEMDIPTVYRGQEPLKEASGDVVKAALACIDPVSGVMPFLAFRSIVPYFSAASSSIKPISHFALGINVGEGFGSGYMKVTSPLRRYKDMMMHWLIKERLLKEEGRVSRSLFTLENVFRISERISDIEKRSEKVSSASSKFWALEWIQRREILWRSGAPQEVVDFGIVAHDEKLADLGVGMPGLAVGPRGPVIWNDMYRGHVEWGALQHTWEVSSAKRCARPTYKFVVQRISDIFVTGILGDLGGVEARIHAINGTSFEFGDIVTCVVDTIDPAAGILIMAVEINKIF